MATKGLLARIGSLNEDKVAADASFTFADSDAQYTTHKIEMPFNGNASYKRYEHMITVQSPSTETALTVDVFNVIEDLVTGIDTPARVDTFTVTAKDAHVDAAKAYYYDVSALTYTEDTTDFGDADDDDVSMPGHALGEVGDALLIGHGVPFNQLYLKMSTAKTDVSNLVLEYSKTPTTWGALEADVDINDIVESTDLGIINFTIPTDWAKVDLTVGSGGGDDPIAAWYIRIRCSEFTSADTQGLIDEGSISTIIAQDTTQRVIKGLYMGADRVIVTVNNATAIGAAKTPQGAGGFTGNIRLEAL
jgi:hypothetical protein